MVPASCARLDLALVRERLVLACGNVSAAAKALSVPSADLRRLVLSNATLANAAYEQIERALDKAHAILMEGLRSEDFGQRLRAAKLILAHGPAAKGRG
jgi:hypothetical protein